MEKIIKYLLDTVCHTTTVASFLKIYESGYIKGEPNQKTLEHKIYSNCLDMNNTTYVRSIGGVSLFDFKNFSLQEYDTYFKEGSYGELYRFLPMHQRNEKDGMSIWLVIGGNYTDKYIDRLSLKNMWEKQKNSMFMPNVEATILEDIPINWIKKVIVYKAENKEVLEMSLDVAYHNIKNRVSK